MGWFECVEVDGDCLEGMYKGPWFEWEKEKAFTGHMARIMTDERQVCRIVVIAFCLLR